MSREDRHALYHLERIRLSSPRYHSIDTLYALSEASRPTPRSSTRSSSAATRRLRQALHRHPRVHRRGAPRRDDPRRRHREFAALRRRDPELAPTLHKLRSARARSSSCSRTRAGRYTEKMMTYLLGGAMPRVPELAALLRRRHRRRARSRAFFQERRPLMERDGDASSQPASAARARPHLRGRQPRTTSSARSASTRRSSVLYVGDHIYGDILRSKKESRVAHRDDHPGARDRGRRRPSADAARHRRGSTSSSASGATSTPRLDYQRCSKSLQKLAGARQPMPAGDGRCRHSRRAPRRGQAPPSTSCAARCAATPRSAYDALERGSRSRVQSHWGRSSRRGNENSRFGEQVEDYACLYTSRVSNFLAYSPLRYFRSPRDQMPHELV